MPKTVTIGIDVSATRLDLAVWPAGPSRQVRYPAAGMPAQAALAMTLVRPAPALPWLMTTLLAARLPALRRARRRTVVRRTPRPAVNGWTRESPAGHNAGLADSALPPSLGSLRPHVAVAALSASLLHHSHTCHTCPPVNPSRMRGRG